MRKIKLVNSIDKTEPVLRDELVQFETGSIKALLSETQMLARLSYETCGIALQPNFDWEIVEFEGNKVLIARILKDGE